MNLKNFSCTIAFLFTVSIYGQAPLGSFSTVDSIGCAPLVTKFNSITPNAKSWKWDFGNGNTSTLQNPTEFYSSGGNYTVTLDVIYKDGTSDHIVRENYILCVKNPEISTSINSSRSCHNSNFIDIQNNTGGDNTFLWDFGDGVFSTDKNPYHQYNSPGVYQINVIAKNLHGCTSNSKITEFSVIKISPPLINIIPNPIDCKPSNEFTLSTPKIDGYSYAWSFNDGTTSSGQQIDKTFNTYGNQNVTLITSNSQGCADTSYMENRIKVLKSNYSFDFSNQKQCKESPIIFKINGALITEVKWEFGDGQTSDLKSSVHNYNTNGKYDIKATIKHSAGCTEILTKNNAIEIGTGPTATFSVSDTAICVGQVLGIIHNYPDSNSIEWNFGDGQSSHQSNPTHKYIKKGKYTVSLITRMGSCSDTTSKNIIVTKPSANFTNAGIHMCAPIDVSFTNLSSDAKVFHWQFGSDILSEEKDPKVTLFKAINYDVSLIATDEYGCSDTLTIDSAVKIANDFPNTFNPKKIKGCAPLSVSFSNLSIGSGNWLWDFGDGTISHDREAQHTYSSSGNSIVSLSTRNNSGCVFTIDTFAIVECQKLEFDSIEVKMNCPENKVSISVICPTCKDINWSMEDTIYHASIFNHLFSKLGKNPIQLSGKSSLGCTARTSYLFDSNTCSVIPKYKLTSEPGTKAEVTWRNKNDSSTVLSSLHIGCKPLLTAVVNPKPNAQSWSWNFGDGNSSTQKNPHHLYDSIGSFSLTFTYTENGIDDTLYMNNFANVTGHQNKIIIKKKEQCFDLNLQLESANKSLQSYLWTIDQQLQLNNTFKKDTILKKSNNIHLITLTTSDSNYCNNTQVLAVAANSSIPLFQFKNKICLGDSVNIEHNIPAAYDLEWDFGDQNKSSVIRPNHVFESSGEYHVFVKMTDKEGCSTIISAGKVLIANPNSQFKTKSAYNVCVGDTIKFTSNITTNQLYSWNVVNGTMVSSEETLSIIVDSVGFVDISLVVNENSCTDSTTEKAILIAHKPIANFTHTTTSLCAPIVAEFVNLSTPEINYYWSFGDGTTSTQANPNHQFNSTKKTEIDLIVVDENGCTDEKLVSSDIFFHSQINLSDSFGCAPAEFLFSESSSNIASWHWDFGDGMTDTTKTPTHTYQDTGKFDITLITLNNDGCVDTTLLKSAIEIDKIVATYDIKKENGCAPISVDFENQSINSTKWLWDFGNGNSSTLENPKHNYYTGGQYVVKLTAENENGCIDSIISQSPLEVQGPYADFSIKETNLCEGDSAYLINKSKNADFYTWILGDGHSETTINVTHKYQELGSYQTILLASDSNGCESISISENTITIYPLPSKSFTVSDTIGCSPLKILCQPVDKNLAYKWFINDSLQSTQIEFNSIFKDGKSKLKLISENKHGCTTSSKKTIILKNFIVDSIRNICQDQEIIVIDSSATFTNWSIDGELMNSDTIKLKLLNAGLHKIIFESKGVCLASDTSYFNIDSLITANIIAPQPLCSNSEPVELKASSSPGAWYGTGITNPFNGTFDAKYSNIGDNIITYTVNNGSCSSTDSNIVSVTMLTSSSFTLPSKYGCESVPITFTPSQNCDGSDFLWTFIHKKDTIISNDKTPLITLGGATWEIQLQVSNEGCQAKSQIQQLIVFDSKAPSPPLIKRSTVENNNSILTEWQNLSDGYDKIEELQIWRSLDSTNYDLITTKSKDLTFYNDENVNVAKNNYFYKIIPLNKCQIKPEQSNVSSNIVLEIENINSDVAGLKWSKYYKWKEGVDYYEVQKKDINGNWIAVKKVKADSQSTTINK